jgi:hypothetical protein
MEMITLNCFHLYHLKWVAISVLVVVLWAQSDQTPWLIKLVEQKYYHQNQH